MTRKKSNVKALAIAVTCAILAGGYSSLNPVYADSNQYFLKKDANGVIATTDNPGDSARIDNLYLPGSLTVDVVGTNHLNINNRVFDITDDTISITSNGVARGLNLTKTNEVISAVNNETSGLAAAHGNIAANAANISANGNKITALESTVNDTENGLVKKVTDLEGKTTEISYANSVTTVTGGLNVTNDASVGGSLSVTGTSTFTGEATFNGGINVNEIKYGSDNKTLKVEDVAGAVSAVDPTQEGSLAYNTQKITYKTDPDLTSSKATFIEGTTYAGGVKLKDGNIRAGEIVLISEEITKEDGTKIKPQATLTRANLANLNNLINESLSQPNEISGKTVITAGDGSIVGNLKFTDNTIMSNDGQSRAKITVDYNKVTISVGNGTVTNPVVIDEKGLKVGTGTAYIANDGFKVSDDGKNTLTAEGLTAKTIKVGSNSDSDSAEFKVGADGKITTKGGLVVNNGTKDTFVVATDGSVNVTGSTTFGSGADTVKIENGNVIAKGSLEGNSLKISTDKFVVDTNGNIDKAGDAVFGSTANQVKIASGKVTAPEGFVVNGTTELTNDGLKVNKATIDNIVIDGREINSTSEEGLKIEGVTINEGTIKAESAKIGANTLNDTGLVVDSGKSITVGSTEITTGQVKVSTDTYMADKNLHINDNNTWTATGITASKADINGVTIGETKGKATFNNGTTETVIDGGTIKADKLLIDNISLGKDGNENIAIDKDGNVNTKGDITVTDTNGDTTVIDGAKATFGKDTNNQTVIDKGNITASAKNTANSQKSTLTHDYNGFKVEGTDSTGGKTSSFGFSTETGIGTFTGHDGTTTAINGSKLTSKISDTDYGELNGSSLNLKNGLASTVMSAGGATYNNGTDKTIIDGGTITTETLKTNQLILGNKVGDSDIVLNADGSLSAANGAFAVAKDGRTTFGKDSEHQTAINGGNIYAKANTGRNGAKSEFLHTGDGVRITGENGAGNVKTAYDFDTETGKAIIEKTTGGVTSSTTIEGSNATLDDGKNNKTELTAGGATFTKDSGEHKGTTTIDGNTITTGKLITDKLVIKGSGNTTTTNPDGTPVGEDGSIAFGGDGTITSNIKDGSKETTFDTKVDGVTTTVTDGTTTTENKVEANGNTNTVTKGTDKSEFKQTATSIGGVVTNGTVKMEQKLTSEGLQVSDLNDNPDVNVTKITNKDVSIADQKNAGQRINLSDLGQIDDLNNEDTINSRSEYDGTVVGGVKAVNGRLTDEVNRLDGRINDVSDRVNKVGAMAAAIASLKSIGYDPQAPSEFSIGLGQYKGETGVAMGFFHYPNKNFMINVSLSTAGGETMGGIGATWRFGHKSPQKLLDEQRAAQAKKELAAAEKYQAAAKLAKEAQERAEYAAKLARQAQVSADNAKAAADATAAKHF